MYTANLCLNLLFCVSIMGLWPHMYLNKSESESESEKKRNYIMVFLNPKISKAVLTITLRFTAKIAASSD